MQNSFIADIQHKKLFLTFGFLVKTGEVRIDLIAKDQKIIVVNQSFSNSNFIIIPIQIQKGQYHISVNADGEHLSKTITY